MFLICGLGNPGKKYENTRHNIGFKFVDKIINQFELNKLKIDQFKELYFGEINNFKIFIIKPLTFMNLSGHPIQEIVNFYKINLDNVFVAHDDLDLDIGKIKIKQGGGNGGHNGLSSIDDYLGKNYKRIRIGINHPGDKSLVTNYVLNNFTKDENDVMNRKINKMIQNIQLILEDIPLFLTKISEEN